LSGTLAAVVDPLAGAREAARDRGAFVKNKKVAALLFGINIPVLAGQLWPAGAPPFARVVNIAFLCATLIVFAMMLRAPR